MPAKCSGCLIKRASFGYKKEDKNKFCKDCKLDGMVDIIHKKCEHNRRKSTCRDCKGSSICEHNRVKSTCRDCKGSLICEHNKHKSKCKDCKGSSICEHNRVKSTCRDCKGSSICEHNKQKSTCKDCKGSSICEHNRRKSTCKDCKGGSICIHDKQKSQCIDCCGGSICIHDKRKSTCRDCGGSQICEHNREKSKCKDCNFNLYLINIQRGQIYRCFKSSLLEKNRHSIEYLGCDIDTFINHFQKKIDYFNNFITTNEIMTIDNIHIDHIKPVSRFNLDNEDEFNQCCHYTNLQPLLAKDNLEKHNKWNDTNETYWKNNIINNENFIEIYYDEI